MKSLKWILLAYQGYQGTLISSFISQIEKFKLDVTRGMSKLVQDRSRRTRVRNWKAIGTLPCLCFSPWFYFILILSITWFLCLSGSQDGIRSLPSSLHDSQVYLTCYTPVLRITCSLSLLIPCSQEREADWHILGQVTSPGPTSPGQGVM